MTDLEGDPADHDIRQQSPDEHPDDPSPVGHGVGQFSQESQLRVGKGSQIAQHLCIASCPPQSAFKPSVIYCLGLHLACRGGPCEATPDYHAGQTLRHIRETSLGSAEDHG